MGLNYLSLDQTTRELMVEEFNSDIKSDSCYTSTRFHEVGKDCYFRIMPEHLKNGSDDSLAEDLRGNDCFNTHETDKNGKQKQVPVTASKTFSEGEFNRFYMRAVAIKAISEDLSIEVYRARYSENPSPESEAMIGKILDSEILLKDLRVARVLRLH